MNRGDVVLKINCGLISRIDKNKGLRVILHDYDVDSVDDNRLIEDEDGNLYEEIIISSED